MVRLSCSLLIWLVCNAVAADTDIRLEIRAGLGGHSAKGATNELGIDLFTTRAQSVELLLEDGFGTSQLSLQLSERRSRSIWIPVKPANGEPVRVRLVNELGVEQRREVRFGLLDGPMTVISNRVPLAHGPGGYQPVSDITPVLLSTTALPHTSQAYAGVETVISSSESLSRMSADQYSALEHYLRQCNILLISDATDSLLQALQEQSGCQGRFVRGFRNLDHLAKQLTQLRPARPAALPGVRELDQLGNDSQSKLAQLGSLLVGYLLLVGLGAWRLKNTAFLFLLPVVATAAILLVWTGAGSKHFIHWAEMYSADSNARVSSLLRLEADRRGTNQVAIDKAFNLADSTRPSAQARIVYRPTDMQPVLVEHTALFSPRGLLMNSVIPVLTGYSLTRGADGVPRVDYNATTPAPTARLLWQGKTYDLPTLDQGRHWSPRQQGGRAVSFAEERLLNRRLSYSASALLLPFPGPNGASHNQLSADTGWLVIRQAEGV